MIILKESKKQESTTISSCEDILAILNETKINAVYIFTTSLHDKPTITITNPKRFTASSRGLTINSNDGLWLLNYPAFFFKKEGVISNKNRIIEYILYTDTHGARMVFVTG
jgi:hypothetical protein